MMQEKSYRQRKFFYRICFTGILILHLAYGCFWGNQKINYHIDEYYTYGLANNRGSIEPVFEDGVKYHGDSLFLNYLAPDKSECFDYSIVWENQAADVHPPLYYVLIHTVCSFFPDVFSKWEALFVNLILLLVVDILILRLAKQLCHNDWTALWTVIGYGGTLLCVNTIIFLRMYMLMTVFVLGSVLLLLAYLQKKKDWKFYAGLYILSAAGAMTQYYFLIYLFFLSLTWGIISVFRKKWKEAVLFVLTLSCAGGTCLLIFPAMIKQIFGEGYRGKEAFHNAKSLTDVWPHMKAYISIINKEIFGGYGILFVLLAACFLIISLRYFPKSKKLLMKICMVSLPMIGYTVVIAIIAPYQYDRYIMAMGPLFVITMAGMACFVIQEICRYMKGRKLVVERVTSMTVIVLLAAMSVLSMAKADWHPVYTYKSTESRINMAEKNSKYHVLFIYSAPWTVNDNMLELVHFKDYVFLKKGEVAAYIEAHPQNEWIVYAPDSQQPENVIASIQKVDPNLQHVKQLYQNDHPDFANVYYVGGK